MESGNKDDNDENRYMCNKVVTLGDNYNYNNYNNMDGSQEINTIKCFNQ